MCKLSNMVPKLEEYLFDYRQRMGQSVDEANRKFRYRTKLCEDMLSFTGANCECNEIADYTETSDEVFDEIFNYYLLDKLPENCTKTDWHKIVKIKKINVDNLSEDEVMSIIEKNVAMLRRQNERYNTRKLLNLVKDL